MGGRISPEFKNDVLERTDILDIVNARVPLKQAGGIYKACCPFHDEKTPSFTVTPSRQTYHCFGCGVHGNAIDFLIEYDHLSFREAVAELAQRAGMQVPDSGPALRARPDLQPIYDLLEQAARLYRGQLRGHPQARRAVDYLKGRGLTGEIAAAFGLGFAPPGWHFLLTALGGSATAREHLVKSGLLIEQDGKRYDRFRDRIMFPIRDRRGRVIGFGGRVLGNESPKYLNSPETPVFHKGQELYGLYEAQKANPRLERVLVVEGYMDVIALAQFGITYAVATLGTAVTDANLERIFRSSLETIFCFDADRAGHEAAWKTLLSVCPRAGNRKIRFLFLPEGEDPDTLIRQRGPEEFETLLRNSVPIDKYIYENLTRDLDRNELGSGDVLVEKALPLLRSLPPNNLTKRLILELADKADISPSQLDVHKQLVGSSRKTWRRRPAKQRMTPVRLAIARLLQNPHIAGQAAEVPPHWRTLERPGVGLLAQLLDSIADSPGMTAGTLIERWRDTDAGVHLQKLADPSLLPTIPEEGQVAELLGALQVLNKEARQAEGERLYKRTSPSQLDEEEKQRLRGLLSIVRQDDAP
jgi:DNA primase